MKTLANCSPLEFLVQTNKIRKAAENWLEITKVLEIRQRMPQVTPGMTAAEKTAALKDQIKSNVGDMVASVLDEHPKETAELLCLLCFIDPGDMEKHQMSELLGGLNELISNEEVLGFFASLARLAQTSGFGSPKA